MEEIPRIFSEVTPITSRSQTAWEGLMKKTESRPGYSTKLLHSRAIYEYNSSGRVVNTDHRFYDSNEYKDQKSSTKRTKIDLTANSEGVKQILDHSVRSDSRSKGNQRLN
jgi:hypothetical protein